MKGLIVLENGAVFEGESFGFRGAKFGEFVFNTAMTGYQEILTDPSYMGQFVVMTYPHIGNTGINGEDAESGRVHLEGFVCREFSPASSNYRSTGSLQEYLERQKVIACEGVDTRALTRLIREKGAMMGAIANDGTSADKLLEDLKEFPSIIGRDLVSGVTCREPWEWDPALNYPASIHSGSSRYDGLTVLKEQERGYRIAVIDCGVKWNMLRILSLAGNRISVFPASAKAGDITAVKPDGILVSNGPGDPAPLTRTAAAVKELIETGIPMLGICMGHLVIGRALGGKTYKLKFGHHGANHPVKDLSTGKVEISSQNHNFCVDVDSLKAAHAEVTHVHLNDGSVEGLKLRDRPIFSVQYHPESSPGPLDSRYLFSRFLDMIGEAR